MHAANTHLPRTSFLARLSIAAASLLVALLLCCGCTTDSYELGEPVDTGDTGTTWTVMMYLCGSDLESNYGFATQNLLELASCDLGGNVNYVIETGGAKKWRNNVITSESLQRYEVEPEGIAFVEEVPLASMGEASTLADFVSWATKKYPADRTMLIFWDHGGGTLAGVCVDELYGKRNGDTDTLTLPEIAKGLAQANHHFDIIGFDTCLMATLETAQAVQPWADYLVASEETEPGGGWAYDTWPAWLAQYPGMAVDELARGICDSYYFKCVNTYTDSMATLSATDLSKVPALAKAFEAASDEIFASTSDMASLRVLAQGASRSENYGGNTNAVGYTDMVDLGNLMQNTDSVLSPHAGEVIKALDEAVIYTVNGRDRRNAHGLSVFYPLAFNEEVFKAYEEVTREITGNYSYLKYLSAFCGNYHEIDWEAMGSTAQEQDQTQPVEERDYKISFKQTVNSDARLQLTITEGLDAVATVRFSLGFYNLDDSLFLPLGIDNNISRDYNKGVFVDNFEGTWIAIDGNYVNAQIIAEEPDYNLYAIPVMLNGTRSNLMAVWRHDENRFEVLGAYDGIDEATGTAAKGMRQLQDGDEISTLFQAIDIATGEGFEIDLNTFEWKHDLVMEDIDLGDGDYLYRYEIVDVLGNIIYSDPVIVHMENGKISIKDY